VSTMICVHTILRDQSLQFKVCSPPAYEQTLRRWFETSLAQPEDPEQRAKPQAPRKPPKPHEMCVRGEAEQEKQGRKDSQRDPRTNL
jgi:hypothetical protein